MSASVSSVGLFSMCACAPGLLCSCLRQSQCALHVGQRCCPDTTKLCSLTASCLTSIFCGILTCPCMLLGSGNCFGNSSSNKTGILFEHSYGILDVKEVKSGCFGSCCTTRLIKLRNPWGKTEWKGDWSDESSKWNDELKKELGWSKNDDGEFWMEVSDFVRFFGYLHVLCWRENYSSSSAVHFNMNESCAYFDLEVKGIETKEDQNEEKKGQMIKEEKKVNTAPAFLIFNHHNSDGHGRVSGGGSFRFCVLDSQTGAPVGGNPIIGDSAFLPFASISSSEMHLQLEIGKKYVVILQSSTPVKDHKVTVSTYSSFALSLSASSSAQEKYPFCYPPAINLRYGDCDKCHHPLTFEHKVDEGHRLHEECTFDKSI